MGNFLRRLRGDRQGASVIEFALFAPILGMMLMGVTDLAMGYATKLRVEAAIYRTLEKVAVGSSSSIDATALRTEAATAAGINVSQVSFDNWLECNRVRNASFDGACAAGEDTARYVKLTINTTFTPRFRYGPLLRGSTGTVPIEANTSLRIQ